jgi:hypothetical protein
MVVPNPTFHMKQQKSKLGSWLKNYTLIFDVCNNPNTCFASTFTCKAIEFPKVFIISKNQLLHNKAPKTHSKNAQ